MKALKIVMGVFLLLSPLIANVGGSIAKGNSIRPAKGFALPWGEPPPQVPGRRPVDFHHSILKPSPKGTFYDFYQVIQRLEAPGKDLR